jgi:hypothetical protein
MWFTNNEITKLDPAHTELHGIYTGIYSLRSRWFFGVGLAGGTIMAGELHGIKGPVIKYGKGGWRRN